MAGFRSLTLALAAGGAAAVKCGFATDMLPGCPQCLQAALNTSKLDFWWNWKTEPEADLSALPAWAQREAALRFVPMLWGQTPPTSGYGFLSTQEYVMGYNEPDMYGPSCFGEWDPPPHGCNKGDNRAATSAGWKELFDPSVNFQGQPRGAQFWQWSVNAMTQQQPRHPQGARVLVSPSMAMGALPDQPCVGVDPAMQGAIKVCHGWLRLFKENTLQLPCTDFSGAQTSCWDAIDVIQIHAYARTAAEVKEKINDYYKVFQEDFDGANGRKKKTLWLTEVAMASNEGAEIQQFIGDLMNPEDGLSNKDKFGFVEKVSWFSEYSFPAFVVKGYQPKRFEAWSSSIFNPFGSLSPLGEKFFSYCEPSPVAQGRRLNAPTLV